ncbi:hypothetical protein M5M_08290 [Simiduia agarivorans SA1 = DSM 21679]|uniref:DUF2007 domain-containing protein n=1 Tax=Simiduia agarivorans (strain DSM 21679 / JCM 13881 / BCRC 17597 / SA1) TaxID=1117647 RepID=K4KY31_SIMAS|nr:hypothetical protein M5M_08290 [Simiduia agarivorans SA1 = DSM 21679]
MNASPDQRPAEMKRVYSAENLFLLQLARNALDFAGIASQVRNEFAAGASGDLGVFDCWPELWVDSKDAARAAQIINDLTAPADASQAERPCPHCQSQCPLHFERCWQCQSLLAPAS